MKKKLLYILITIAIISPPLSAQVSKTITIEQAGTLKTLLTPEELKSVTDLTLSGKIDQRDFVIMRDSMLALTNINLKYTTIQAYSSNLANKVPQYAFQKKEHLSSIILPDSTIEVEDCALQYCYNLTNIELPSTITRLGKSVFDNCNNLANINLPTQLKIIDYSAFSGCYNLVNIDLPETVTTIGDNAFSVCTKLANINLSDSLIKIGGSAFYKCKSLQKIDLPAKLTYIGSYAFWGSGITTCSIKAIIPPTVEIYTFSISSISIVYVPLGAGDNYRTARYWNDAAIVEGDGIALHLNLYTAGTLSSEIAATGYSREQVNSLILEGPLNNTDFSFIQMNLPNLISIDLSKTTTEAFPLGLFNDNNKIFSVTLPETMTSIPSSTFSSRNLTNVKLPESITHIDSYAFQGCISLTNINFPYKLTSIGRDAFQGCIKLKSIDLPDNVTSLGMGAFENCSGITSVKFPKSLTHIGSGAFENCTGITSIDLPENLTDIGDYAFKYCTHLTKVQTSKQITKGEFKDCERLTSVNFPITLTSIGEEAFANCSSLSNINIPDGITAIRYNTFINCSSLTSINLPDGLKTIGEDAFYNCTNLTNIKLPEALSFIGNEAFSFSNLTNVNLPTGLKTLGSCCFSFCPNLASITFPSGLVTFGINLFYNSNLTEIRTLSQVPQQITDSPFSFVYTTSKLIVPKGSLNAYKSAYGWSAFLNIVEYEDTGISPLSSSRTKIWSADGRIYISSEEPINTVEAFSLSGKALSKQIAVGYNCQMEVNDEKVLIIKITYKDGVSETTKMTNGK